MGLFPKGKSMVERAEAERAKIEMKRLQVMDKNLDIAKIQAEQRKRTVLERRLVA